MCVELPLGGKAGRRHPCDGGCRLGWKPKDKMAQLLEEYWQLARASQLHHWSVTQATVSLCLSRVRGQGDHEGLY